VVRLKWEQVERGLYTSRVSERVAQLLAATEGAEYTRRALKLDRLARRLGFADMMLWMETPGGQPEVVYQAGEGGKRPPSRLDLTPPPTDATPDWRPGEMLPEDFYAR
jgi:hypothetical protein